jgi:hypothetical protein
MEDRFKDEMFNLILSNYEAVESIISNSDEARRTLCLEIQESVFKLLEEEFKEISYIAIEMGNGVQEKNSQIWMKLKSPNPKKLDFVLESFSGRGHFDGNLFLGILNPPPHNSEFAVPPNELSLSNWIINKRLISDFNGFKTNLNDKSTIQKLHTDKEFKKNFIRHIVNESKEYFDQQYPNLKRFLENGEIPKVIE